MHLQIKQSRFDKQIICRTFKGGLDKSSPYKNQAPTLIINLFFSCFIHFKEKSLEQDGAYNLVDGNNSQH